MKNVFFSILVLFMLAFSMLGNVDLVKAESNNILLGNLAYNPTLAIKGLNPFVDITFRVTNIDLNNALDLEITATAPVSGQTSLGVANPADIQDLAVNGGFQDITFRVSGINQNTVTGIYTGTIKVTEVDANGNVIDENGDNIADNFKELLYSINVQDLNPRIVVTSGLDTNSELTIVSQEDNIVSQDLTLQNSGNIALNDLKMKFSGTFTDDTETIRLKVKFGNEVLFRDVTLDQEIEIPNDLVTQGTLTVTVQTIIPQDINLATYAGSILVYDSLYNQQAIIAVPLNINIEPEICSNEITSNKLKIDITDPDNGEDFKIGDEISISVDVENKESIDRDVIVEAMLYNLDRAKRIGEWVESDSKTIENGLGESFDLLIIIPNDKNIKPSDKIILYVKAYQDGDEDKNCNYKSVEVDIDREDDSVIINSFTITPSVISQGKMISFTVGVENIGTDVQNDVYIGIKNDELGLNLISNKFDLKKYDNSDNDKIETFTFTIPKDAEAKDYDITATVYDNGGDQYDNDNSYKTEKVTVQASTETVTTTETTEVTTPTTTPTGAGAYTPTTASILSNLGSTKTLFIIGDIVLVILAVLFLVLIFKKR